MRIWYCLIMPACISNRDRVDTAGPAPLPSFGARLSRLRRVRGWKQAHIAELARVCQTTVSRWEAGTLTPHRELAVRLLEELVGRAPCDSALRRLVEGSRTSVHLITDADHRLLAASPAREAEWQATSASWLGSSLWPCATEAIAAAEASLEASGWWEHAAPTPVTLETGPGCLGLRIVPGVMIWERLWLSDGTPARLCTSLC